MPVDVVEVVVAAVVGVLGVLGEVVVVVVVLLDRSLELVLSKLVLVPIHVFWGCPTIKFGKLCEY